MLAEGPLVAEDCRLGCAHKRPLPENSHSNSMSQRQTPDTRLLHRLRYSQSFSDRLQTFQICFPFTGWELVELTRGDESALHGLLDGVVDPLDQSSSFEFTGLCDFWPVRGFHFSILANFSIRFFWNFSDWI